MSEAPPIKLFYSYAHKDEALREKLETHLSPLVRQGVIETWKDRQIESGSEWSDEIRRKLDEADLILLLISPDFMASDYIWTRELATAMKRHEAGTARVVPVILRATDLTGATFMRLQALPPNSEPVMGWADKDEALMKVAKGIRAVAESLQAQKQAGHAVAAPAVVPPPPVPAAQPAPATPKRPTPASLRKVLAAVLSVDELDAFCSDHFPAVRQLFSGATQPIAKITLLLENADLTEILARLRDDYSARVQANEGLLRWP